MFQETMEAFRIMGIPEEEQMGMGQPSPGRLGSAREVSLISFAERHPTLSSS